MLNECSEVTQFGAHTTWARVFAAIYDRTLWSGERASLRAPRSELLACARGRTVEVGAGTGLNLPHYRTDVDDLVLLEPDAAMRAHLEQRYATGRRPAQVIAAPAEHLPFDDASVDTVVSTLVLCTVDAPDRALHEIRRVLRPDGQFLFIEHVRSESPLLARWQDRLAPPWRRFARGCRCNRATAALISQSGFAFEEVHEASWRAMPPIVRPLVAGRAVPGASNG
jgi:ubiquinone/menaquinone biosynthesis C-methylase UbiE